MMAAIFYGVLSLNNHGVFDRETAQDRGLTDYRGDIPLTVQDLMDMERNDSTVIQHRTNQSVLLGQYILRQFDRQDTPGGEERPELEYTVTTVYAPLLYGLCRDTLLNRKYLPDLFHYETGLFPPLLTFPFSSL